MAISITSPAVGQVQRQPHGTPLGRLLPADSRRAHIPQEFHSQELLPLLRFISIHLILLKTLNEQQAPVSFPETDRQTDTDTDGDREE